MKLKSNVKVEAVVSGIVSLATFENHFLDLLCSPGELSEEETHQSL